jgi:hypothetical protein
MVEELATEYMNLRMTPTLMEALTALAEDEKRQVSQMTRILLEEALAARTKKVKK